MRLLNYRPYSNVTGFPASLLPESLLLKSPTYRFKSTCWRISWALASFPHMWIFFFFLLCHSGSNILERVGPGNLPLPMICFTYYTATSRSSFPLQQCPLMYVHGHLVATVLQCHLECCDQTGLVCLCFGFTICLLGPVATTFMRKMRWHLFFAISFWIMESSPAGTPVLLCLEDLWVRNLDLV